ncbi:MAG: amidohydrolase [Lachnospiraceae bacterium]|nr:amidohydrolase [Lachnospiraceae bacterium]
MADSTKNERILVLKNARILTMCGEKPDIFKGSVVIRGNRIEKVLREDDGNDFLHLTAGAEDGSNSMQAPAGAEADSTFQQIPAGAEVRDCGGNLLMPGFKDAHTHSAMTFLRSSADDMPLQDWLTQQVFPYEAQLKPEEIAELSKLAILEYLTSGITSVMEMYLTPESIAPAFEEMGMRLVQVGGCNNFSQSPELLEKWYRELNGMSSLTSFRLGFHAQYTCSDELLNKIADLAHEFKAPVYTHISETAAEVESCKAQYDGKTPVRVLAEKGIFDYGGAGYHLVHTTPDDWEIMKEHHIAVVTNPGSNTKLASGIAPIADYLRLGIPVAIGTDGPASNNCLDMFREMFLVTGLAKLREKDASAVPAYEVLKMATSNGAHVMGIPDADSIAPGKLADLVLLDLHQPNMQPINNIASNIVYSGSKLNVIMTMVDGQILYSRDENGAMKFSYGEDKVNEIYETCNRMKDRIRSAVKA